MNLKRVSKKLFYSVVGPLNCYVNSFFESHFKRNYLDMRPESNRKLTTEFKLRGIDLVGKSSIDYSKPYDKQKIVYFLDKKYLHN